MTFAWITAVGALKRPFRDTLPTVTMPMPMPMPLMVVVPVVVVVVRDHVPMHHMLGHHMMHRCSHMHRRSYWPRVHEGGY